MKFKDGAGIPKDTMGEFPLPFNTEPQYKPFTHIVHGNLGIIFYFRNEN